MPDVPTTFFPFSFKYYALQQGATLNPFLIPKEFYGNVYYIRIFLLGKNFGFRENSGKFSSNHGIDTDKGGNRALWPPIVPDGTLLQQSCLSLTL